MVTHNIEVAGKTMSRTEQFTVGLQFLPHPGSVEDQPYRLMEFFDEFMGAERRSFGT